MEKITYATLGTLGEEFHQAFEAALTQERKKLGQSHPLFINGHPVKSSRGTFAAVSPADTRQVLGRFQRGTRAHVRKAITAARGALSFWRELGWEHRVAFLRKTAEVMEQHQFELAALLTLEVGKNRFEAIAEVSESIDLILYYCNQMEAHHGYALAMSSTGTEKTRSQLRSYGVWAVISPFNFPLALATGMATGALLGGNTVIFKPASDTPYSGFRLYDMFHKAGLPVGVFNLVTGAGRDVGEELINNREIDGIAFTGSKDVGLHILQKFPQPRPRPAVVEMGGKNPAIVMPSANLDDAAEGVMRSAFGMGGQKCSACSRVYVHRKIYKAFMNLLVEKTKTIVIGEPVDRGTFLGPLINEAALKKYERAVRAGKRQGHLVHGGRRLRKEFPRGWFVEPTIIDELPETSPLFNEEFFAPVLAVAQVKSLDEAINLANDTEYGLTAGIFTKNGIEQHKFFNRIQAGVTYCNRRGGATTGAWPGVQSFGGWKCSGSTGKNALGPHYVAQFMREQSQTIIENDED